MDATSGIEHWLSLGGAIGAILIGIYAALKGDREGAEKARHKAADSQPRHPIAAMMTDQQVSDSVMRALQELIGTAHAIHMAIEMIARDLREASDRKERDAVREELRRLRDKIDMRDLDG